MSLVAVYNALKEANVSNESAQAAVEAIEEKQVHERLAALAAKMNILIGLVIGLVLLEMANYIS